MLILGFVFSIAVHARESEQFAAQVAREHKLNPAQTQALKVLLTGSSQLTRNIGTEDPRKLQGPNNSWHPASRQTCIERVLRTGKIAQNPAYLRLCKAPWMAPVPLVGQSPESAKVCIDQFEFPNIPCEYPVVWSTAATAKKICESMGKRVCNSHEWEGACAGGAQPVKDYFFEIRDRSARRAHINQRREIVWAFHATGSARNRDSRALCGVFSENDPDLESPMRERPRAYYSAIGKSLACQTSGSDFNSCGTNTWPAGFKSDCRSRYDVYDLHGNVAEVTSLPETADQLADGRGRTGGTERKGSFFVYRSGYPDDCRVRQPYEHHGNYATDSMAYYQEGFRCCKDIE